jgi:hypothetical protein
LSLPSIAALLKKSSDDVAEIIGKMSTSQLNEIIGAQKSQVKALFGSGDSGAEAALELLKRGEVPNGAAGMTRETLEALKTVSANYLNSGRPSATGRLVHEKRLTIVQTMIDNLPK